MNRRSRITGQEKELPPKPINPAYRPGSNPNYQKEEPAGSSKKPLLPKPDSKASVGLPESLTEEYWRKRKSIYDAFFAPHGTGFASIARRMKADFIKLVYEHPTTWITSHRDDTSFARNCQIYENYTVKTFAYLKQLKTALEKAGAGRLASRDYKSRVTALDRGIDGFRDSLIEYVKWMIECHNRYVQDGTKAELKNDMTIKIPS